MLGDTGAQIWIASMLALINEAPPNSDMSKTGHCRGNVALGLCKSTYLLIWVS